MSAAKPAPRPESSTNSIEIFIDADGQVTFTDLPEELRAVAESLSQFEPELSAQPDTDALPAWCALYPDKRN